MSSRSPRRRRSRAPEDTCITPEDTCITREYTCIIKPLIDGGWVAEVIDAPAPGVRVEAPGKLDAGEEAWSALSHLVSGPFRLNYRMAQI